MNIIKLSSKYSDYYFVAETLLLYHFLNLRIMYIKCYTLYFYQVSGLSVGFVLMVSSCGSGGGGS